MRVLTSGFFLLTLLALNPSKGISQTNFIDGLIVTEIGDTLYGKIDFQNWHRNPANINFIQKGSNDVQNLVPGNVTFFSTDLGRYVSKKVSIDQTPLRAVSRTESTPSSIEKRVFLKVLVRGEVSLFFYKDKRDHFYIEENNQTYELISNQYLIKRRGRFLVVRANETKYQEQLSELDANCAGANTKKVRYKVSSLTEFILKCNDEGAPGYVSYTFNKGKVKVKHGPYLGTSTTYLDLKFSQGRTTERSNYTEFDVNHSFLIGYRIKFIQPGDLEKKAFVVGFDYSKFESTSGVTLINLNPLYNGFTEQQTITNLEYGFETISMSALFNYTFKPEQLGPIIETGFIYSRRKDITSGGTYDVDRYSWSEFIDNDGSISGLTKIDSIIEDRTFNTTDKRIQFGVVFGVGLKHKSIFGMVRGELRKFRLEPVRQRTISLTLGYEF